MKPVLKSMKQELNMVEGGRKYKYTLTYEGSMYNHYAYSNNNKEDFCNKVTSVGIAIANESGTKMISGATFNSSLDSITLRPIYYNFTAEESNTFNDLFKAVDRALFKLFSRNNLRIILNCGVGIEAIQIASPSKQDDAITATTVVIIPDGIFKTVEDDIIKYRDTTINDNEINVVSHGIPSIHGTFIDIASFDPKCIVDAQKKMCRLATANLHINNSSRIFPNSDIVIAAQNVVSYSAKKDTAPSAHKYSFNSSTKIKAVNLPAKKPANVTVTVNVVVEDYSQVLSFGECHTYKFDISSEIAKYIRIKELTYALIIDKCNISNETLKVANSCNLSNISIIMPAENNINIDVLISDIKDYVKLSKISGAEWIDLD